MLEEASCMERTEEMTLSVDLVEVADIITNVRNIKAMERSLEYAKILQKDNKISIVMTAGSWQAATDTRRAEPKQEDVPRMLRQFEKKQELIETYTQRVDQCISEVFAKGARDDGFAGAPRPLLKFPGLVPRGH